MQRFSSDLLEREIAYALTEIGGKEHLKGYHTLRFLIQILLENECPPYPYFRVFYKEAAQKWGCSIKCIHNQCRYCIRYIWNHYSENEAALKKYFSDDAPYVPDTHMFISEMAKKIHKNITMVPKGA